ncbi:MAG: hypothetical protein ACR2PT_21115 [Endozoicomonas sp.]
MNGNKGSLLEELERLRTLLRDERQQADHGDEHIPVLTDIADNLAHERQTVAVLSVGSELPPEPPLLQTVADSEGSQAYLKHQLRKQARLMIQDIIDEELVRVEAKLNRELNAYLEHLLDTVHPSQQAARTPWEQES